jgi:uncharacterized membrane protein YqgA involved in biofilm formation
MQKKKNPLSIISLMILILGGLSIKASAYVDPGTAGFLYQLLYIVIAAVIGYFAGLKRVFKKFFRKRKEKSQAPQNNSD